MKKITPRLVSLVPLVFLFWLGTTTTSIAQSSTVTSVRVNGLTSKSTTITIITGNKRSQKKVKRGTKIDWGTKIIIPGGIRLFLETKGGTQEVWSENGLAMEYTVSDIPDGESHDVKGFGATIRNWVRGIFSYKYRSKNSRGNTAASNSTRYTFRDLSDDESGRAFISTSEGSVTIVERVPLIISNQSNNTKKGNYKLEFSTSRLQRAEDSVYISSDQPVEYVDYKEATARVESFIEIPNDPEVRANNQLCLGALYLEWERSQQAIPFFSDALNFYFDYYGEDDADTLEAKLFLAKAYQDSGRQALADEMLRELEETLLELLRIDEKDLDYVDENDPDAEDLICEDIVDTCALLGWLYKILGEDERSQYYYSRVDQGC